MSSQVMLLAQEPTKWDFKTLAGTTPIPNTFVALGSPTSIPAKQMIISSTVNQDLIFCFDNTSTDQLRIPAGNTVPQVMVLNLRASNDALPQSTQILVRGAAATASGQVNVTLVG